MKDIGRRLQAAREAKGLTLETAEAETKIRRKYLEALESGREADLPGEAYLKGFLRTYGNFLGLDGPDLVEQYKAQKGETTDVALESTRQVAAANQHAAAPGPEHPVRPEPRPARAEPRPAPVVRERPPAERTLPRRRSQTPWLYSRQAGIVLLSVIVIAGLGYLGWRIYTQVGGSSAPAPAPTPPAQTTPTPTPTTPQPPVQQPAPPTVTLSKGEGSSATFAVSGAKQVEVRLEPGTVPVWMQAFIDGSSTPSFDGYPKGPLDFKGNTVRLRMGHMDGISLVVNGQRFDKPLESGPWTLNFTLK